MEFLKQRAAEAERAKQEIEWALTDFCKRITEAPAFHLSKEIGEFRDWGPLIRRYEESLR